MLRIYVRYVKLTCSPCYQSMFDMLTIYVRHVHYACSTCSLRMFDMFTKHVRHVHLHVPCDVTCSSCMFFSGGHSYCVPLRTQRMVSGASFLISPNLQAAMLLSKSSTRWEKST